MFLFESVVVERFDEAYERYTFHCRLQQQRENLDAFLMNLTQKAKTMQTVFLNVFPILAQANISQNFNKLQKWQIYKLSLCVRLFFAIAQSYDEFRA